MSKETANPVPAEAKTEADSTPPTATPANDEPFFMADHDEFGPLNERDDDGRDQRYGFRIPLSPPLDKSTTHQKGGELIILSDIDD